MEFRPLFFCVSSLLSSVSSPLSSVSRLLIVVSGLLMGVGAGCSFYILQYVLFTCPFCPFCRQKGQKGHFFSFFPLYIRARMRNSSYINKRPHTPHTSHTRAECGKCGFFFPFPYYYTRAHARCAIHIFYLPLLPPDFVRCNTADLVRLVFNGLQLFCEFFASLCAKNR